MDVTLLDEMGVGYPVQLRLVEGSKEGTAPVCPRAWHWALTVYKEGLYGHQRCLCSITWPHRGKGCPRWTQQETAFSSTSQHSAETEGRTVNRKRARGTLLPPGGHMFNAEDGMDSGHNSFIQDQAHEAS